MMPRPSPAGRAAAWLVLATLWGAAAVSAQTPPPATGEDPVPPAHLAAVEGTAWLERQGRAEPALANVPLVAGDRLRTERGRLEVLFGDGSALYADHDTTVDLQSEAVLRLLAGRIRLVVSSADPEHPDEPVVLRVDTPGGTVELRSAGDYRLSVVGTPAARDLELAVLRGSAVLATEAGSVAVRTGERALAREGAAPSFPVVFNSARWDAFDRWTEERRAARVSVHAPAALPAGLTGTCGIPRFRRRGARTRSASGSSSRRSGGRGSGTTRGRGRRIISAAGAFPEASGSGFPGRAGRRRGSRGRGRRATSPGVRSASTAGRS